MKPLIINPTDIYIISPDNYEFYFNKLLASKGIEIQNDVLTKEVVKANCFKLASIVSGFISAAITIYKYMACHGRSPMNPDTTMRAAGLMAAGASTMFNRTNTLVNGYGPPSMFHHRYDWGNDNDKVNVNVHNNVNDNSIHVSPWYKYYNRFHRKPK